MIRFLIPLLAVPLMAQVSLEGERLLGQSMAAEIRRSSAPVENSQIIEYVGQLRQKLLATLQTPAFDYKFEVISAVAQAEPFSAAGGYVFIPIRAFLESTDEAEFVSMIAHAMGHAELGHGRIRDNSQSIPLIFLNALHAESQAGRLLVPTRLVNVQRAFELEADRFGIELLARAGYDPAGIVRYAERMHPTEAERSPFPPRELRIATLKEMAASLPAREQAPADEEFRRLQKVASIELRRLEERRVPTLKRASVRR